MTGYKSKRAAAQDKLNDDDDTQVYGDALNEDAIIIQYHEATIKRLEKRIEELMAQPEQEPVAWMVYTLDGKSVCVTDNPADFTGQHRVLPLYTTPTQRPWVEPTESEWFEWWRVSQVADATEAEIDFADFLIIAQAVLAKLKEKNT